jgi:hypothetical protein
MLNFLNAAIKGAVVFVADWRGDLENEIDPSP